MLKEKMAAALAHAREVHGAKTQKDFARAVGMPVDRLANIVQGKVKKLQRDEAVAIERAYGIRSAWWFSDLAPMLLTPEERALQGPLGDVANASAEVLALGLSGWQAGFVQELLFNVRRKDAPALSQQLQTLQVAAEGAGQLSFDEVMLLGQWRRCTPEDQAMAQALIGRLAQMDSDQVPAGKQTAATGGARSVHDKPIRKK